MHVCLCIWGPNVTLAFVQNMLSSWYNNVLLVLLKKKKNITCKKKSQIYTLGPFTMHEDWSLQFIIDRQQTLQGTPYALLIFGKRK